MPLCRSFAFAPLFILVLLPAVLLGQSEPPTPEWLWLSDKPKDGETVYFRKTFEVNEKLKSARFSGSCDNVMTLFINGKHVLEHSEWGQAVNENIAKHLVEGKNVVAVRARNEGGIAAFMGSILLEYEKSRQEIVSKSTWLVSADGPEGWQKIDFEDTAWKRPHSFGKLGVAPWGRVALFGAPPAAMSATLEEAITVPAGFKIELLYSVPKASQGSWVSMTPDPKGRLIASDQGGGLYRATPGPNAEQTKVEKLSVAIGQAQGLLCAFDSLYVVVNGSAAQGSGLYRVRDTDGDDQYDEVKLLKKFNGGGEHGPHAVRLGPDGKLYVVAGNFTKVPEGTVGRSPHRNWAEDLLLPRNPDGGGHDPHIMAPGGWVARTDPHGESWELLCAGLRNSYDIDFNQDGELFTYDSDMEWDTGTPWYRPTRVNHCVSAAEFGWRNGTGKWPDYSADSLGAVVDIGLGSPTGVCFGTGAKFPAKYQRALFINDWTYGKIYAVHMTPNGATYTGTFETFVSGKPLPVTDIAVNTDGALYFTIGGRGTQSGLYRVTYVGTEPTAVVGPVEDTAAAAARKLRRQLEAYHVTKDPKAVEFAWPHLNSSDRAIRYAARVAIENQALESWKEKALSENRMTAQIYALLALTRTGDKSLGLKIVERLNALPFKKLSEDQLLAAARVYGLAFIRLGEPEAKTAADTVAKLGPLFPAPSEAVNRELCTLLVYLKDPTVVPRAMQLLAAAQTQEDQLFYVLTLRNMSTGWTPGLRKAYFSWTNLAEKKYRGGASFVKFVQRIRTDALATTSTAERAMLIEVLAGQQKVEAVKLETTRQFVHNWQIDDLAPLLEGVEKGRSFEKGKAAYHAAQCAKCHRFAGEGGDTGPDITGVGNRFTPLYLLESLILPAKVVSDQYATTIIETEDGEVLTGRIMEDDAEKVKVRPNPFTLDVRELSKKSITARRPSNLSEMPQGLINVLAKEEILDLIAYMRSAGKADDNAFMK
jgi:putative heme-binding domain-containing protein